MSAYILPSAFIQAGGSLSLHSLGTILKETIMQNAINTMVTADNYRLALADNKGIYYFMLKQIVRLQANNVYTTVYFDGYPPFTVSKVLGTYDELLKPFGFIRTHRSHLVNREFVKCITTHSIIMQDASVAELARRKKQEVIKQLATSSLATTNTACFT